MPAVEPENRLDPGTNWISEVSYLTLATSFRWRVRLLPLGNRSFDGR